MKATLRMLPHATAGDGARGEWHIRSRLYKRRRKSCKVVHVEAPRREASALAETVARCLRRCAGSGASLQRSVSLLAPALGRMLGPLHCFVRQGRRLSRSGRQLSAAADSATAHAL